MKTGDVSAFAGRYLDELMLISPEYMFMLDWACIAYRTRGSCSRRANKQNAFCQNGFGSGFNAAINAGGLAMAKGQMRSNKEKKKPKADKNKKQKGPAPSPFGGQGQGQPGANPFGKK
jgi:hypothetical protein